MMFMLLVACATTKEERKQDRQNRRQLDSLTSSAELYWRAMRWNDLAKAAGFLQDPVYRTEWLTTTAFDTTWRYRNATVLRADLGPVVEEGEMRDATVIVDEAASQLLESVVLTQQWYLDNHSWWVQPGQERGVAP